MKTFFTLLKVDLLRLFGINKALKSGKGGRRILLIALAAVFIGLLFVFESGALTFGFASFLPDGERYKALAISICMYVIVVLFLTIGSSRILFGCSDFDLLMSLPVKSSAVVLSKIAYVYIIDFLFALALIVPAAVICGLMEGAVLVYTLCGVLYAFFIPLLPMAIGLGLGTLVAFIFSKIKNKAIANTIGAVLFFLIYFLFLTNTNGEDDSAFFAFFQNAAFAPIWFIASGVAGNLLGLAATLAGSAVIGGLTFWCISANYKAINLSITARVGGGKFVMTRQNQGSLNKTLFRRELKLFFSSASCIINSLVGSVLVIILSVLFLVNGGIGSLVSSVEGTAPEEIEQSFSIMKEYLLSALPFLVVFFISSSTYASYSISLEGKRLWVIKSLPITAKKILEKKACVALLFSAPFAIIATVLVGIGINASVWDVLFACVIALAYCVCDIMLALLINMKYNNFDWKSEAEVVKRGSSVLISMLIGMLGALVMAGIQFAATIFVNRYFGWISIFALLVGLSVLFGYLLFKNCEQKFKMLGE